MAYTLQNLLVDAYRELGELTVSTATGGTTSTIVDSKFADEYIDDAFKRGAMFIIRDAGGESAAPEGQMAYISGYTDSSGTFTGATSCFTAAPATGDTYGFVHDKYPLYDMIELANQALLSLGDIPLVDTTSLDTAASQTEYECALAWKRVPPFRVDIQTITNDANDNQWRSVGRWEYIPATAGSTGLIVLDQLPSSRGLRIWYKDVHPTLTAYNSTIFEGFHPQLVTMALVEKALNWQRKRNRDDTNLYRDWVDAKAQLAEARLKYPIWMPKKQPRYLLTSPWFDEDRFVEPDPAS